MNLKSIWDRFGSIWGLGRIFGGFGAPLSAQDRILIDFKLVLGPLVGSSRPQLGGLEASWGVLWLSLGSRESFHIRSHFRSIFGLHFASILDPQNYAKIIEKSNKKFCQNQERKRLISMLLPLKFQEILMLKPKRSIFKNYAKTKYFCAFSEYVLMSTKNRNILETNEKSIKNKCENLLIFDQIFVNFRHRCANAKI